MKKLLSILILFMVAVCANAQHLKFMGIPIDGKVDNFQIQLTQKGLIPNSDFNATHGGAKMFTGMFFGYKAEIFVYYNPRTKIVYRCKACITDKEKSKIDRIFYEMKTNLQNKYADSYYENSTEDNNPNIDKAYSIMIARSLFEFAGSIELYTTRFSDYGITSYELYIDYYDYDNEKENDSANLDDL